jgi:hypothetical protein
LHAGDTLAANNNPMLLSYKVGSASGAVASIGFNSYVNTAGVGGSRINAAKNGWAIQHDVRTAADTSLLFGVTSSAGVTTVPITFTVDGGITVANNQALGAGANFVTPFNFSTNLSGTKSSGNLGLMRLNVITDTMSAAVGGGMAEFSLEYHGGGGASIGNRLGLNIDFNYAGGTGNKAAVAGNMFAGQWTYARASGNVGGTSGSGNSWGSLWGGISSATLQSGATFWDACIAHEFNMGISAGASAARLQGVKIALQNNDQVLQMQTDYMLGMGQARNTNQQMPTGISFGSDDGYWPIRSDGRLISTVASNPLLAGPLPYACAFGIDFSAVTFSTAFLKSTGFTVDGSGNVAAAGGAFTTLAASGAVSGAGFTALLSGYATTASVPVASSTLPLMNGSADIGAGTTWAKADHVHPSDTSRYAASNPSGYQTAAQITTALAPYALTAAPTLTGTVLVQQTTVTSGNSGLTFQMGDSVAANANSLCYSYQVGASGGAIAYLAFNLYITGAGAVARPNTAKGAWFFQHDTRTLADAPMLIRYTSAAGVNTNSVQFETNNGITVTGPSRFNSTIGFNNTAPVAKPTVSGAKGSNAALASLMTALAAYGLVTDSTSA